MRTCPELQIKIFSRCYCGEKKEKNYKHSNVEVALVMFFFFWIFGIMKARGKD